LQKVNLVIPLQTLQTQALICCDFHQSVVDNFIAIVGAMKSPFVYPLYFTGDRRPQRAYSQFSAFWQGDCL